MQKLTLQSLKDMEPGIFAKGTTEVEDYWDTSELMKVDWVAVRGGIHDWAIYCQASCLDWKDNSIRDHGDKMRNPMSIKKCVPCDEEAFEMYRY